MNNAGGASYDRAPSRQLRELLASDGFLAPLFVERTVAGIGLDVHLRRGDEVDLCCRLICLVKSGRDGVGSVRIESHRTYASQPCASGLFRPGRTATINRGKYVREVWTVGEAGFAEALDRFLNNVRVAPRQTKEGAVQARWSGIDKPWIAVDKEAALEYPSVPERRCHLVFPKTLTVSRTRSRDSEHRRPRMGASRIGAPVMSSWRIATPGRPKPSITWLSRMDRQCRQ